MSEHLKPELFVDLLEGSPVEARWREHVEGCQECRGELREIEGTLRFVREADRPVPRARWRSFRFVAAAAVAAALVVIALGWYEPSLFPPPEREAVEDAVLPPLELDEDFTFLLAMSRTLPGETVADAVDVDRGTPIEWDLSDLTPGEREALLERLAMQTRSGS